MRKGWMFLLLLGLCWFSGQSVPLFAQEEDFVEENQQENQDEQEEDDPDYYAPLETDWEGYMQELYSRGDQTFTISLGVTFPTVFLDYRGKKMDHNLTPPVGGTLGPLTYTYFLTSRFFVGGEIAFLFNHTLGDNTIFLIPIGVQAGWQFIARRFEFPIAATIGVVPQRYLDEGYVGMFVKGGGGAFFRFNPDWSFGLNVNWSWYPQWPRDEKKNRVPKKDVDGNMLGLTLSARYHL